MRRFSLIFLVFVALFVVGCGEEEPTPTARATMAPTSTPEPTATDLPPTETPEPTETPIPTETPEPTATPIPASTLIGTGDTQLLLSDWQGAEDAYRQAIANEPENALAHSRLAYLLQFHPETYAEAVEVGRESLALAPNDPVIVSFFIMTLVRVGAYEEALPLAEQIEFVAYNEVIALGALVDLYMSIGDFEKAEQYFSVATSISALAYGVEEIELNRIFAKNYYRVGNRSGAIQYANRLEENGPSFAPAYLVRAEVLTPSILRTKNQRELIIEGLLLDSDYLPLMVALAHNDARAGNFELALDSCEDVIRLFAELVDGLLCQGDVLLTQGLFEEAQASFEQVLEQDDQDYRAYIGRGRALLALEDCETAENELLTAIELRPYAIEAYAPLAESHLCQGESDAAEAVYAEGLAIRPFDSVTNFSAGNFYLDQNRVEEASDAFVVAALNSPSGVTPSDYFINLGRTLTALNECSATAVPELGYYTCSGDYFLERGSPALAVRAYSLALEIDEESIPALEGTITAYANVRLCEVAEPLLDRLREITTPSDAVSQLVGSKCAGGDGTPVVLTPDGDLISEDEAIDRITTAVEAVNGVDDAFVFFDTVEADDPDLGEARLLFIQFITDLERDDPELERQLSEMIFAAAEGFALTDSEPLLMIVQARLGLVENPAGYVVTRFSAIAWYNGTLNNSIFRQTWTSFDEIAEQVEQGG